ncbi:MAG: zf-HC2 domain-containing protein [Gemmatimonadetes bacterium]|nr:zf-HC2 domain-containing protein [Gemmatimonadota bacterium]
MPHPNDGHLMAWLDGELEPQEGTGVREHIESCAECRDRANSLRQESEGFSRAVLVLDDQVAGLADPGPLPIGAAMSAPGSHRLRKTGWSLARAAGLILVAAGAAAAFVPGSPVRAWFEGLGEDDRSGEVTPSVAALETEAPSEGGVEPTATGISVDPLAGSLVVDLQGFGRNSNVHVRLTDARRATVRVEGTPGVPRFVTGPGTLEVIGAREGEIWVELPRSIRDAVVRVDGDAAVRIEDGRLVILRPVLDSLRGDVVFRIGG